MKTGSKLASVTCEAQVMVVRGAEVELLCGGRPMVEVGVAAPATASGEPLVTGHDGGTVMGKRYAHEASGLQVLCVKPGAGSLSVDGDILEPLASKQLPSSD